jgi:hypothetical protein
MSREQETADRGATDLDTALEELRQMISRRYPSATFTITHGDDPEGVYLIPTVDTEDIEEVFDVVVKRLVELQVDDRLPLYVLPVRPEARVLEDFRSPRPVRSGLGIGRLEAPGVPR